MRTKQEHIREIKTLHTQLTSLLDLTAEVRRDIPMGSYVHKRLCRSVHDMLQLRTDLWFTCETLEQNGYGEAPAPTEDRNPIAERGILAGE